MSLFSTTPPVSKFKNVTAVIDWFSLGLRLYSTAKEKSQLAKLRTMNVQTMACTGSVKENWMPSQQGAHEHTLSITDFDCENK